MKIKSRKFLCFNLLVLSLLFSIVSAVVYSTDFGEHYALIGFSAISIFISCLIVILLISKVKPIENSFLYSLISPAFLVYLVSILKLNASLTSILGIGCCIFAIVLIVYAFKKTWEI